MADEQDEREGIADFLDMTQDYPSIYNRSSKDFKGKFKKENCWKAVAERVIEPVDVIKKRYENIRTQFGKYLKKRKGTSGAGATIIILIDPQFERLMRLKNFTVTRPNPGNFRRKQMITKSNMELAESDEDEDNSNGSNDDSEEKGEIISNESICSQANPGEEDAEECKTESQQQRNENQVQRRKAEKFSLKKLICSLTKHWLH